MQGLIVEYFTFYKVAIANALAFDISRLRNDQPFHHYILPAYAGVAAECYPPPPTRYKSALRSYSETLPG